MIDCPSSLHAASAHPGLGQAAVSVLASAVPEFLGALGAALVIAAATAVLRRLRRRTPGDAEISE
ncbi:hypothetical protein ACIQPR_09115 [Streptomyces sp. NPDC091280]|uniref:hypothetical protein n=1 Tax=Streptomyces sp. NPDC091280 TaxID=3365984 RepID=UPI0037F495B5